MTNLIALRLDDEQLAKLKAYRKQQDDPPSNGEAARELFLMGMEAWEKQQKRGQK